MRLFKKKSRGPQLTLTSAEQILNEVFDACGHEKNTVPLNVLLSYANYRKEKYTLQKTLIIGVLLLFMLLPLLFITAKILVAVRMENENGNPVYEVTVAPYVPVESIQVMLNGRIVPVYKTSSHSFTIRPSDSGEMSVSITLFNKQTSTDVISVEDVDTTPPSLVSVDFEGDDILITLEDSDSGISFSEITLTGEISGETFAFTYDEEAGLVRISYPGEEVLLSVPDKRGNILTVQLNP